MKRQRLFWLLLVTGVAVLTWARIALIDSLVDQGWFAKYVRFADAILAGDPPRNRIGDVSPLYLWTMVLFRAAGLEVAGIRALQLVLVSGAAVLCAAASYRIAGRAAAVATAILILGNRAALIIGAELEPEALIMLLNAAALFAVVWWTAPPAGEDGGAKRHPLVVPAAAGLLIGLSAVARPVALGALVLVAGWLLLRSRRAAAALVFAALLPVAAVLIVNRAVTAHLLIMQPGSQFYDGNNPLASGAAGVLPVVINDLDGRADQPDYLHVAYRVVAARAMGGEPDARASNRYWSGKALAFIRTYPSSALELFAWKAVLSVHHYDIYDLISTRRKAAELSRYPAIPFGVSFVLALLGLALHRPRSHLIAPALFALATLAALILFNVSARQRNALLVPLAVMGGVGVAAIIRLARERNERALHAFAAGIIAIPLLGIEGRPMQEDAYNWWSSLQSTRIRREAFRLREAGERERAIELAAAASLLDPPDPPLVSPPTLRRVALAAAAQLEDPRQLFDAAIALQKAGAWLEADQILARISDYRPERENRAVSSVSYYRARAALRRSGGLEDARTFLDRAVEESPGDPNILALRSVAGDPAALPILERLHDPFTRDLALAIAFADSGNLVRADELLVRVQTALPEWHRPTELRHALRTGIRRSDSVDSGRQASGHH